jgi:SAM-dependent methyltransferase
MSRTGLSEAREKLGAAGSYVEADLTALPFRDGAFGGFICAHALYHVPADEQEQVVRELFRTLSPGGTGVILYTRPDSPITRAARVYARYRNRLRGTLATRESTSASTEQPAPQPDLYYHPHEYTWWDRLPHEWNVELRPLTSVDREFTTTFIPDNRLGVAMLRVIAFLEERFPRGMVRLGRYPLVILRKPSSI